MSRIDSNKTVNESGNNLQMQGEFERMRSMRVDDAMLIEKLRCAQSEVQDTLNEIIGVLQAFIHSIESQNKQRERSEQ